MVKVDLIQSVKKRRTCLGHPEDLPAGFISMPPP
jgi:hypothetical protein